MADLIKKDLCSASTSWMECKNAVQAKKDELAQINVAGKIAQLNQELVKSSPSSQIIDTLSTELSNIKQAYYNLYGSIVGFIKRNAAEPSLSELLSENGTLQESITSYHKMNKEMKVDVESAVARDEQLRSKDKAITSHKLFFIDRPIRRERLPYWWVLGIFFIGVAVYLFRQTGMEAGLIQTGTASITTMSSFSFKEFIMKPNTLLGVIIVCVITIIGLGIRMATM